MMSSAIDFRLNFLFSMGILIVIPTSLYSYTIFDQRTKELVLLANKGDKRAQYKLGRAYLRGTTVKYNRDTAYVWLKKSAGQNYYKAWYSLGKMRYTSKYRMQNYKKAFHWFMKAAKQNHGQSQYYIALIYFSGNGVSKQNYKAMVWAVRAEKNGSVEASDLLSAIQFKISQLVTKGQRVSSLKAKKKAKAVARRKLRSATKAKAVAKRRAKWVAKAKAVVKRESRIAAKALAKRKARSTIETQSKARSIAKRKSKFVAKAKAVAKREARIAVKVNAMAKRKVRSTTTAKARAVAKRKARSMAKSTADRIRKARSLVKAKADDVKGHAGAKASASLRAKIRLKELMLAAANAKEKKQANLGSGLANLQSFKKPAFDLMNILDVRKLLYSEKWAQNGSPSDYIPSSLNQCIQSENSIHCISRRIREKLEGYTVHFSIISTITEFRAKGEFTIRHRKNYLLVLGDTPEIKTKMPVLGISSKVNQLYCRLLNKTRIECLKPDKSTVVLTSGFSTENGSVTATSH